MTRALPGSLSELIGFGGVVRVRCRKCKREAEFRAIALADWFKSCGIRDDWKTIRAKFVCDGCGARNAEVTYELDAPDPPKVPPLPRDGDTPLGVDPGLWAAADHYERRRLIRRARN